MRNKAISLVMVLAMVLSLMPTFALADGTDGGGSAAVAEIGTAQYTSLQAAVDAAKSGDTITLLKSAAITADTTLNLSGKTVETNGYCINVQTGSLTVTGNGMVNNKEKGTSADRKTMFLVQSGAALTIENGTYTSKAAQIVDTFGTATIKGGTFVCDGNTTNEYDSWCMMVSNGTAAKLTVEAGTLTATAGTDYCGMNGVYALNGASIVLGKTDGTGPSITTDYDAIGANNTTATCSYTIYGGTYTVDNNGNGDIDSTGNKFNAVVYMPCNGNYNISGGTFKTTTGEKTHLFSIPYNNTAINLNITGGNYDSSKGNLFFIGSQTATFSGTGGNNISVAGGTFSSTSALNYLENGANVNVKLAADETGNVAVPAGTTVTLDLNGKTLANTGDYDTITNNGTLTVTGSGNVNNDGKQTAALLNNGTATLKRGTFKRTNAVDDGAIRWYVVQNHGIMTLDGATIEQATKNTASALINGWSGYTVKDTIPSSGTAAATLTITSGTVLNGGHTLKQCSTEKGGGTFTVNGGTFTCESGADVLAADAAVTVNGGNFSGTLNKRTGSISVKGGYFTADPSVYVAAGYKAVSGGYTVGSTTYSYKVSAVPANKIESATAEAYKDADADIQTEVIATVSGSTITVSGKLPADDNKVVITYTCTDNTTGTATLNYANGAFTAAALTVGTTTYTINFDSLSVLSAEVKVAAPAVPAVSPVADNASDVEKDAVTEINKAIAPEAASHPSAEGLAAAVADSALETTTDAQGNTVTNVTTSAGTQTATQIIADKRVTIEDNAATGLKAIKDNSTDNPAVVTVVPVMKIAVTGADIVDGKQTLTLDITAMSQVVVTTKNVAGANINTTAGDSKQNAIAVGDPLEVTVNTPVTIKVPIPKILYDNAPLYIKHTHNNIPETVLAELSYSAAYYATFELSGLSEVTFLSDPRSCTINYYSDETGTDYETKTITPADTGNANGYMTMPTVAAPTGKTFSGWKLTATTSGVSATTEDYPGTYTEFTNDMLTHFAGTIITARPVFTAIPSSSTGGGASTAFTVTVNKSDNGTVTSSAASAEAGKTVTLTVAPAAGYVLDTLAVTDSTTKNVATVKAGDNSYSFTMPALNVTVAATFKKSVTHPSSKFTDVDQNKWYVSAIDYAVTNGLFNGVTETSFDPDAPMTRAMLVTVMYRLAGSPAVTGTHGFTDVPAGAYYEKALIWAVQNKVVNGISKTEFAPSLPVLREQVAAILYRYAKANGADVSIGEDTNILSYDDALEISDYAVPAFQWACGAGILQGDNNKLLPKDNATRAQIAAIVMRAAGKLGK